MAKTSTKSRDLWYEHQGERHRVVVIEYQQGHPFAVATEEHWDYTGMVGFRTDRDQPRGTVAHHWNFEWCRRDQSLYYSQVGYGGYPLVHSLSRFVRPLPPPSAIWTVPGVRLTRSVRDSAGERVDWPIGESELLGMGYVRLKRPKRLARDSWSARDAKTTLNPFEAGAEGSTVYCDRCDDFLPCEDTNDPCGHIHWCNSCGLWVYGDDNTFVEDSGTHECKPE